MNRREIRNNSAIYEDLLVVKAAIEGHILIIEGIEKCERNVLPILNNLLENREMLLEDGRFLVHHDRYDKLLQGNKENDLILKKLNLIRAHPNFRVIALGLPVPQFPGNPMDPPLRSRFQCRDIVPSTMESHVQFLSKGIENYNENTPELIQNLVTFSNSLQKISIENENQKLPHFPDTPGILHMLQILTLFPGCSSKKLFHRVYPYMITTDEAEQSGIHVAIDRFLTNNPDHLYKIKSISNRKNEDVFSPNIEVLFHHFNSDWDNQSFFLYGGHGKLNDFHSSLDYFQLEYHDFILAEMIQDHLIGVDLCIVGEKGIGKSSLAQRFCDILGYSPAITMHLYQDMSARDLLQRRATQSNGDTIWELTPLIYAALHGSIAILDGIDRLVPSTFSILQRLCQDRECTLFDGTKLIRYDRYQTMLSYYTKQELENKKIYPIHPSFRIIALANLPTPTNLWLTSEVIPMFHFHYLRNYSMDESLKILHSLFPSLDIDHYIVPLLKFDLNLREKAKEKSNLKSWRGFTFRQILRLCKRWITFPLSKEDQNELLNASNIINDDNLNNLHEIVHAGFSSTQNISLHDKNMLQETIQIEIKINDKGINELCIGDIHYPVQIPKNPALVPKVNFFNMPTHVRILKKMLQDFIIQGKKRIFLIQLFI